MRGFLLSMNSHRNCIGGRPPKRRNGVARNSNTLSVKITSGDFATPKSAAVASFSASSPSLSIALLSSDWGSLDASVQPASVAFVTHQRQEAVQERNREPAVLPMEAAKFFMSVASTMTCLSLPFAAVETTECTPLMSWAKSRRCPSGLQRGVSLPGQIFEATVARLPPFIHHADVKASPG
jgi:hypothetical protein